MTTATISPRSCIMSAEDSSNVSRRAFVKGSATTAAAGTAQVSLRSIADLQADGMNPSADEDFNKTKTSNAVRIMRYGVKSRAYGVN